MAEKKHGITLFVRDKTEKGFDSAKKGAKSVGNAFKGIGKAGGMAFKALGTGAVMFNQGLELVKKGVALFRETIGAAILKSLEFRDVNDRQVKDLKKFQKTLEQTGARIGDMLLPIINSIGDVMGPLLEKFQGWLEVNRKIVGGKIIEWGVGFSKVLVQGIAFGANLVVKGVNSARVALIKLQQAGTFFEAMIAQLAGSGEDVDRLADEYYALSKSIKNVEADSRAMEDALAGFQHGALKTLEAVRVKGMKRLEEATSGANRKIGELKETMSEGGWALAMDESNTTLLQNIAKMAEEEKARREAERQTELTKIGEHLDRANERRHEARLKNLELAEAVARQEDAILEAQAEKAKSRMQQFQATAASVASGAGRTIGSAFAEMAKGARETNEILKDMLIQLARMAASAAFQMVMSLGLGGATGGIAGGGLGGVLGGLLGFSKGGMVPQDGTPIQRFATGGFVTGGVPNRDSVPALLTPGEFVVSKDMMAQGGGGGPSVTIVQHNSIPQSRTEMEKNIRTSLIPALNSYSSRPATMATRARRSGPALK